MEKKLKLCKGIFEIGSWTIRERPEEAMVFLSQVLVVRAEQMWFKDAIEYHALSTLFRQLEPGECAPRYNIVLHKDKDGNITLANVTEDK